MKKFLSISIFLMTCLFLFSQNFDDHKIYLWDNDYGAVFVNPDDDQTNIGYEYNVKKALNAIGFTDNVKLFEADTMPKKYSKLSEYAAIFIVTGHYPLGTRVPVFSLAEIDTLSKYLNWGGCVYFEGNNVMEFLKLNYPVFYAKYFNDTITQINPSSTIDSLISDPATSFCKYYKFNYPENSVSDSGVDILNTRDTILREPHYFKILYFDEQQKLYKSTATAYTPPETKGKYYYFPGKTFVQTVDLGAFSYQTMSRTDRSFDDSIKSQYIRMAYLKDVLRFFGLSRTLVVIDDGTTAINASIGAAMGRLVDYDSTVVTVNGPAHASLMPYTSVFWYTDTMNTPITLTDTFNLGVYLDYGGNLFLASDNFAEQYGANFPFTTKYLGSDFVDDSFPNDSIYASSRSFWYYNDVTDTFVITRPTRGCEPDLIKTISADADTAFFIFGSGRTRYCCGVKYESITHNSVFLSFPFQRANVQTKFGFPVDSILKIALRVYFDYDFTFEPHDVTFISECNISYILNEEEIKFLVLLDNPKEGGIKIFCDEKSICEERTNSFNSFYKISVLRRSGQYRVEVSDADGEILNVSKITIEPLSAHVGKAEFKNNLLYMKGNPNTDFTLIDISGREVMKIKSDEEGNAVCSVKQFPAGIYFIKGLNPEKYFKAVKI